MLLSIMAMATQNLSPSRSHGWCWEMAQSHHHSDEYCEDQWRLNMKAMKIILAERGGIESIDSKSAMRKWLYL